MNIMLGILYLCFYQGIYAMEQEAGPADPFAHILSSFQLNIPTIDRALYHAPLHAIPDEQLPPIEQFFGNGLPQSVQLLIERLQAPATEQLNRRHKNCVLFEGPPGVGKSTLAQIIARRTHRELFYRDGGNLRTGYQASGSQELEKLFRLAIEHRRPCIILIDEINNTTQQAQTQGRTTEDDRSLAHLITLLDTCAAQHPQIVIMGTTNYPESIDPAILSRSERIAIIAPDQQSLRHILTYYLDATQATADIDPQTLTALIGICQGLTGRDIQSIIAQAVDLSLSPSNFVPRHTLNGTTSRVANFIYSEIQTIRSTQARDATKKQEELRRKNEWSIIDRAKQAGIDRLVGVLFIFVGMGYQYGYKWYQNWYQNKKATSLKNSETQTDNSHGSASTEGLQKEGN